MGCPLLASEMPREINRAWIMSEVCFSAEFDINGKIKLTFKWDSDRYFIIELADDS